MMRRFSLVFIFPLFFAGLGQAQTILPDFNAENLGKNKVRISWVNNFGNRCIQLNVQASKDSLKGYRTIFSTESPQLPQNGFIYVQSFPYKMFYRIFYILDSNQFMFSAPKIAGDILPPVTQTNKVDNENKDTLQFVEKKEMQVVNAEIPVKKPDPPRIISIYKADSLFTQLEYSVYKKFRDSVNKRKDTLLVLGQNEVQLKPFDPASIYTPSIFVLINQNGFVKLNLPDAASKKYKVVFYELDGKKLFSINNISDTAITIDKTDFIHAGWFKFELYENEKLIERNKILLQKDLR
ncbi:hypothetical protein [Limnovirga soli]|uniref:Uncharacterized protein n=1 Tax=Limnovirga soli TaxID=2656915 RepID=A0A8J8FKK6_9BACT|nr:hypothetical protein [Limnovirga soli]NNV57601.1 hypothetical protein [Limnovirga soli]